MKSLRLLAAVALSTIGLLTVSAHAAGLVQSHRGPRVVEVTQSTWKSEVLSSKTPVFAVALPKGTPDYDAAVSRLTTEAGQFPGMKFVIGDSDELHVPPGKAPYEAVFVPGFARGPMFQRPNADLKDPKLHEFLQERLKIATWEMKEAQREGELNAAAMKKLTRLQQLTSVDTKKAKQARIALDGQLSKMFGDIAAIEHHIADQLTADSEKAQSAPSATPASKLAPDDGAAGKPDTAKVKPD